MLCGFGILIIINLRSVVFKLPKFSFDVLKVYMNEYECLFMYVYVACMCYDSLCQ